MNPKKTIKQFIGPSFIPVIVLLIIPFFFPIAILVFLCATLPVMLRANKAVSKLEEAGLLEQAAAELTSPSAKHFMDGKAICTDHYLFCKRFGYIFTYEEIAWVYKHRFTQRMLFIPISVTDSLYLATKDTKAKQVVAMRKDKMDQIKNLILEIYSRNRSCLIGYSDENIAAYKAMHK